MSSTMYINFKSENRLALICLEKNLEYCWSIIKINEISGIKFFFSNIADFKTSMSCSSPTKIGPRDQLYI